MKITTSAPGKLLLYGDHAVVYGRPCIVTAVNQRLYVTVEVTDAQHFQLKAPDLGLHSYTKAIAELGTKDVPKAVRFLEALYKRFLEKYPQTTGVVATTKSDFSAQFGFGSSSAVTVAFAKALCELYGIQLDHHQLFALCYQSVIDVQGVGSGFDIAAAIWGGTLYYVTPAKIVEKLDVKKLPLIVGYTGIKADTPTIVRMVESYRDTHRQEVDSIFDQSGQIVEKARQAMNQQDWSTAGKLMTQNQQLLTHLQVSGLKLDQLIAAAQAAGAFGAKLSGAGGGDCMVALSDEDHRVQVEQAITAAGGIILSVELDAPGVRCEK